MWELRKIIILQHAAASQRTVTMTLNERTQCPFSSQQHVPTQMYFQKYSYFSLTYVTMSSIVSSHIVIFCCSVRHLSRLVWTYKV